MAPEDAQLVDRTGPLQFGERGGECGVELLRLDRVEHGADLIVAGDPVHREQGLAVGPSLARRQMPLMRQEGRALHEKRGERRHAEIGHGVDRVPPLPLVGDRQAATANGSDQAVRRGGHPATESTKSPRRKPSSACRRRLSQTVAFETQRPTSATQLASPASRSRSAADRQNEKCWSLTDAMAISAQTKYPEQARSPEPSQPTVASQPCLPQMWLGIRA